MDTYRFRKHIHRLPGKVIHAIPLPEPEVTAGHGARREIGAMCRKAGYKQVLLKVESQKVPTEIKMKLLRLFER